MTADDPGTGHTDLDATEARSGRPGVPVLWVLVVSTIVALIAVVVIWAFFFHGLSGPGGERRVITPAQAKKFDTPTVSASTQPGATRP
jgi:hypothetical protein